MHKLILWFFNNLNNIGQTLSLICSFLIMTTIIYWLEAIFNVHWVWLDFIKPVLDHVLNIANSILPFSFYIGNNALDGKYIIAVLLLIGLMFVLRYLIEKLNDLKYYYDNLHDKQKKIVENHFNTNLKNKVVSEEIKISDYMILIRTKLKKKFTNSKDKFNIQEQNNLMNRYIFKCTNTKFELYNDGFLYKFDDFNKIDSVLDVMFKIINSTAPLDYSICIQAGNNISQLDTLAKLEHFGKIVFCADTLLRYKCNNSHRYGTECAGIIQLNEEKTLEIHEFKKIL